MMDLIQAIGLTTLAGLFIGVGGVSALTVKKSNNKFLAISLGFSAGIMVFLSLAEIFPEAKNTLSGALNEKTGALIAVACFFGGIIIIGLIDRLFPHEHNPHEAESKNCKHTEHNTHRNLMRTGVFTALAIVIHNIPEGIAMLMSFLQQPTVALPLVLAVALHNIPAGMAISIPIYLATGNKKKAFLYALVTGLSQPLAAIFGYALLTPIMNEIISGVLYAVVAGVLVFIALDDLLPCANEYGEHHHAIYGMVAGMAVMGILICI